MRFMQYIDSLGGEAPADAARWNAQNASRVGWAPRGPSVGGGARFFFHGAGDPNLADAVAAFQEWVGVDATGRLDANTIEELRDFRGEAPADKLLASLMITRGAPAPTPAPKTTTRPDGTIEFKEPIRITAKPEGGMKWLWIGLAAAAAIALGS